MKAKILFVFFLMIAPNVLPQSPEEINPDDTITIVSWSSTIANFVTAVTDADDGTYVFADNAGQVCRYSFADISVMPSDATADSIIVRWRAQDQGSGNNRQRIRLMMDGITNFCDGANISVTTSWVDYEDRFTEAPSAAGTCGNAWGTGPAKFDSVNVQLTCTALGNSREVRITELDVDCYYTEAVTGTGKVMRLIIGKIESDGSATFVIPWEEAAWLWVS